MIFRSVSSKILDLSAKSFFPCNWFIFYRRKSIVLLQSLADIKQGYLNWRSVEPCSDYTLEKQSDRFRIFDDYHVFPVAYTECTRTENRHRLKIALFSFMKLYLAFD